MINSFQYQNVNISYRTEGEGINVLLVHGFAEDSRIWDHQVEFLKSHCRLIVPDLPGSGLSTGNRQPATGNSAPSTIEYYADCMYALLQHEKIEQCIMLGHSMGGYITLAFAEKFPRLLKAFGLIHSSAFADSEEKKDVRKKAVQTIEEYGPYSFLKNTIPNLFAPVFKQNHPEIVNKLIEQGRQFSKETLQQYYTAMMNRPDRTSVLQNSEWLVLFVIGTEDKAAPMEDVLKQVHLPKISYIHVLENVAHMGMLEEADLMNKYLLEFVEAQLE